jgi:uncharacterized membrane protein YsdA (DUF1294 family)
VADNAVILFLWWLGLINVMSFIAFGWDKLCARAGWWRVPEPTLLLIAMLGGSPAARLGQTLFRHKTRKQPFARTLKAILIVHGVALVLILAGALGGALPT